MGNDENLKQDLEHFIDERLQESYIKLKQNNKYKNIIQRNLELLDKLERNFTNDFTTTNELWEEYTKIQSDVENLELQDAYKTGFFDCATILLNAK